MAVHTAETDRAEQLEARCRKVMAEVTRMPRGWDGEADRREDMKRCDVWLDAYNLVTLGR